MTDKPIEIPYTGIIDLSVPVYMLYGKKFAGWMNCNITVEYVSGHEPQFFHTGPLLWEGKNSQIELHQKRHDTFSYECSEARGDLNAVWNTKDSKEAEETVDELKEEYNAIIDYQSRVSSICQEFRSSLQLDQNASSDKTLTMNRVILVEDGWLSDTIGIETFYLVCHPNKKRVKEGEPGKTVLKFSIKGQETKYAVLIDDYFTMDKNSAALETLIQLKQEVEELRKRVKDKKSGWLTPQQNQPDNFGVKPDYLNKDWLLGAVDNPLLASAGIAR